MWQICLETWQIYWGSGGHIYLFLLGLLYLILRKREKQQRKIFGGYTLAALFVFFFPFTAYVIVNYCIGKTVYWRMLWLLPVPLVIAYLCTRLCLQMKNPGIQMVLAAICLGVVVLTGSQVYVKGNYHRPANGEKIAYDVKTIADMIRDDAGDRRKKLAAPDYIATYTRIYAPDIRMPYGRAGRGALREESRQLYILLNQEGASPEQVAVLAKRNHCNYLVAWVEDESLDHGYGINGYSLIGICGNYHLYKRMK